MRISLRLKLTLISLLLLLIPLIGFRFSAILQSSLLASREEALMFTARAVATALANRPDIFDRELFHSLDQNRDLYLFHLSNSIRLNGKTDDWQPELQQSEEFGAEHVLSSLAPYRPESLKFRHLLGQRGKYLYALFLVHDDRLVYRDPHSFYPGKADHIQIGIEDRTGELHRYLLAAEKPGWLNGFSMDPDPKEQLPQANEPRIQGVWAETGNGYTVELRIPLEMIGKRLAFAVADVDDEQGRGVETIIGTANPGQIGELGWLLAPSTAIEALLNRLDRPHSRIRVIDNNRRVRALFGSLKTDPPQQKESEQGLDSMLSWLHQQLAPVYRLFTEPFTTNFTPPASQPRRLDIQGIEEGLQGKSSITHYRLADARVEVMAAITPLQDEGNVVGAVVVEQTTNSILALKNKMIEESIGLTVMAFVVVGLGLLLFASRISSRIRRLRNQAASAISKDGRIVTTITPVRARDEIGDLSRTLASMLIQLKEQNEYREKMADNLEHEMRTPLAGISASLKNLEKELPNPDPEAKNFIAWALRDVQRMESLLTAIRDATSLQEALGYDFPETFDLSSALALWLEHGWGPSYPQVEFIYQAPPEAILIHGDPDRLRQMLEKLIDNAISFHRAGTPVTLRLSGRQNSLELQVSNEGATIAPDMLGHIFNSMVSLRTQKEITPHLGLGLYVVRTIIEHHRGTIRAENLSNGLQGVCFTVTLPRQTQNPQPLAEQ
ncbi:MAG: histidine kinase [Proteobacteria bacterium]|nr:histidine kinase [Pseudomonadota bacterium]MBU1057681.1 histidine kinase [Pseudomonadota bacterium]